MQHVACRDTWTHEQKQEVNQAFKTPYRSLYLDFPVLLPWQNETAKGLYDVLIFLILPVIPDVFNDRTTVSLSIALYQSSSGEKLESTRR